MTTTPRIAITTLALLSAGVGLAGNAHADDMGYLQALNNSGLTVYDTADALAEGHQICDMLTSANGTVVARYVFTHTSWSDVPTMLVAETMVIDAVASICPGEYHPGNVPAPSTSTGTLA
jgi:hypothetical protein